LRSVSIMYVSITMYTCADWPDYEGESDSETGSETEVIVAGGSSTLNQSDLGGLVVQASPALSSTLSSHWELEASAPPVHSTSTSNIPAAVGSQTAQKIMHLLDEIGTSNLVERPLHDNARFLHCDHCSGRLIVL